MTAVLTIPTIKTRRLSLRAPGSDDVDRITSIIQDEDIVRWLARVPWPYERVHAEAWVKSAPEIAASGEEFAFAIDRDGLIGLIGMISIRNLKDRPELGYWLGKLWWGNGFMTEAARAVVGYAFDTLRTDEIVSGTFDGNLASQALLKRLGFVITGESKEPSLFHGKDQRHIDMLLTREAFEANRP